MIHRGREPDTTKAAYRDTGKVTYSMHLYAPHLLLLLGLRRDLRDLRLLCFRLLLLLLLGLRRDVAPLVETDSKSEQN